MSHKCKHISITKTERTQHQPVSTNGHHPTPIRHHQISQPGGCDPTELTRPRTVGGLTGLTRPVLLAPGGPTYHTRPRTVGGPTDPTRPRTVGGLTGLTSVGFFVSGPGPREQNDPG